MSKKNRRCALARLLLGVHDAETFLANVLALVVDHILGAVAENAGGLVLF